MRPTGSPADPPHRDGAQLQRIEHGKIAEERVYLDRLGILVQLGLVPEPATA